MYGFGQHAYDVDPVLLAKGLQDIWFDLKNRFTPIEKGVFTVLDTETTGLDIANSELIEVTAVRYKNGQPIGEYSTLIKPSNPIPPHIEQLTKIYNPMVANAPDARTALMELARFVGPAPLLVGHYVNFDIQQIQARLKEAGLESYAARFELSRAVCTKTLGQRAFPELVLHRQRGSLDVLGQHLGVANPARHRAKGDVQATAGILYALVKVIRHRGLRMKRVQDLFNFQGAAIRRYDEEVRAFQKK